MLDIQKQIAETWDINNRINLYLLNGIEEKYLENSLASKGRTVGEQFAHIHNVRLMWLKEAASELLNSVQKIEKEGITKKLLLNQLSKSGGAIHKMIETCLIDGRVKGFKPHPAAYLGYIVAHEAHHRSQIILALKQSGNQLDKKILFGLWEWGTK